MTLVRIDQSKFEKYFPQSKGFLLICFQACCYKGHYPPEMIKEVSVRFSKNLKIYLFSEDDLEFYQHKFNFLGTPILILFRDGEEKARLMGKVSKETLTKFISKNIGGAKLDL